jgi:membrane-associated phospholipid phosphatase
MGLALSLAVAFMVTQGMKLLFGKPRPDFLSRCNPDLNRIAEFAVNPVGERFNPQWVLVTSGICQNRDDDILQDGFKSFPSGHSSCKCTWLIPFYA